MPERPVRQIIDRDSLLSCPPTETVRRAASRMADQRCGSILVMDGGRAVGIFTERDLLIRVVAAGLDPDKTAIREVMTPNPATIGADQPVREAIRAMDEGSMRYLPVLDGNEVIGMISAKDLPYEEIGRMARELTDRHRLAERIW